MEWHESIRANIGRISGMRGHCYGKPDPKSNRIAVEVHRTANDNVETEVEYELSRLGVPREAVIFVEDDD